MDRRVQLGRTCYRSPDGVFDGDEGACTIVQNRLSGNKEFPLPAERSREKFPRCRVCCDTVKLASNGALETLASCLLRADSYSDSCHPVAGRTMPGINASSLLSPILSPPFLEGEIVHFTINKCKHPSSELFRDLIDSR